MAMQQPRTMRQARDSCKLDGMPREGAWANISSYTLIGCEVTLLHVNTKVDIRSSPVVEDVPAAGGKHVALVAAP